SLPVRRDRGDRPVLPAARPFDADHVRAEIGEQHGAIGTGHITAEVQHPNAVQRTHADQSGWPRVTGISAPLIERAPAEARNRMMSAIACGCTHWLVSASGMS